VSRERLRIRLAEKVPSIDFATIEARLFQMAAGGPPTTDGATAFAVPPNPAPCDEEVNGGALPAEVEGLLTRPVVLPAHASVAIALWIVCTYVYDRFYYSARLLLHSPGKRCGKSLALRVIAALVARPLKCENITVAALYRAVEKYKPTMLLDEAD